MPPVPPRLQTQKPKPEKKQTGNKVALIIITVVVLIVGAGIAAYFFYPPFGELFRKTPEQQIVDPPIEEPEEEEEPEPVLQPQKQESSSSVDKGFYVIVGSYRLKSNADNLVKTCRKDIELQVLYFEELGLYRVSAGKYDNIRKAYNDTYSIKDLDGCENAWVLENI